MGRKESNKKQTKKTQNRSNGSVLIIKMATIMAILNLSKQQNHMLDYFLCEKHQSNNGVSDLLNYTVQIHRSGSQFEILQITSPDVELS